MRRRAASCRSAGRATPVTSCGGPARAHPCSTVSPTAPTRPAPGVRSRHARYRRTAAARALPPAGGGERRRRRGTAALLALVVRFALEPPRTYVAVSMAVPAAWIAMVALQRGYEARFLGTGPEEYRRATIAAMALFIAVAVTSFACASDVSRRLRAGRRPRAAGALAGRPARSCAAGSTGSGGRAKACSACSWSGRADAAVAVIDKFRQEPQHGLLAVAACVPQASVQVSHIHGVPVVGDSDRIIDAVDETGVARRRRGLAPRPGRPVAAPAVLGAGGARRRPGRRRRARRGRRPAAVDPPGRGPAAAARGAADASAAAACSSRRCSTGSSAPSLLLVLAPLLLAAIAVAVRVDQPRAGAVPPGAGRRRRPAVHDAQVPLDGGGRRGPPARRSPRLERRQRPAVQDARGPAGHPGRRGAAPLLARRAAPAVQRAARATCRWSARARRCRRRSPRYDDDAVAAAAGASPG